MKKFIAFILMACMLLSGCAKSDANKVWKVKTLSETESNLPVAPSLAFCSLKKQDKQSETAPKKRTLEMNGETFTFEYENTEYIPDMTGPEVLKQQRSYDKYREKNGEWLYLYESSNAIQSFACMPPKQEAIYTKNELVQVAEKMLADLYPDAKDYELVDISAGHKNPMENYTIRFQRKIANVNTSECVNFIILTSGALKAVVSYDYQVYENVEITETQIENAKKNLIRSVKKNETYDEDSFQIKMGDDGRLYLSFSVNCIKKTEGAYGYLCKEQRFTLCN